MHSIYFPLRFSDQELLIADLWECGTLGIVEEAGGLRAFFDDAVDLTSIRQRYKDALLEGVHADAPVSHGYSHENWDAVLVGKRFFIAPSWVQQPAPPGRMRLSIDGTNAFGSGRHESTQLMIEALEEKLSSDATVLDVGCGSGILLAAAWLLGARSLFGCDVHFDALTVTRNLVRAPIFLGSVDALKAACADIVLVNISARVLDNLAFELKRVAKENGLLILSGFLAENPPARFTPETILERGGWQCWLCRPEKISLPDLRSKPLQPYAERWW